MKKQALSVYKQLRLMPLFSTFFKTVCLLEQSCMNEGKKAREDCYNLLKLDIPMVCAGHFKGMKYYSHEKAIDVCPRIFGTYELELYNVIKKVLSRNYDLVIDVGSAEGYYVVGFARHWPNIKVYAYDYDAEVRLLLNKMMEVNSVSDRVIVKEFCNPEALLALPKNCKALILSDCEGYELDLFTSKVIEHLNNCDIIIESHDGADRPISATLHQRFTAAGKNVETIKQRPRKLSDFPKLGITPTDFQMTAAMYEHRSVLTKWLFIES